MALLRAAKKKAGSAKGASAPRKLSRVDQVAERRQSLLDAAVSVIASQGLIGVTISKIAEEAGCSYGVVSFHFSSKDGIVLAALEYLAEDYERVLAESIRLNPSPAGRLRAMVESDFDERVVNERIVSVWVNFWAESVRVAGYRERCAEIKARYNATVEADLKELAAERGLSLDAGQVARSLNAMIDGFWIAILVSQTRTPEAKASARAACFAYLRSFFPQDF